jgi:membrane protein YqaA with SNARE-associated domain
MSYLAMMGVVFGVNLLPAFGPPTWSVLAVYGLRGHHAPVALVLGAVAAASGRLVLALACRGLRSRLSDRRTANLAAARELLTGNPRRSLMGLALFALSPIPSAQLFEAAGLMGVTLGPVVAVFFAGRLVSYSLYVGGATALRGTHVGRVVSASLTGPWGIALQVVLLGGVVALAQVDWVSLLARRTTPS